MKKFLTLRKMLIIMTSVVVITSCNKDDKPGLYTEDHDRNKMMTLLHDITRRIDSLTLSNDPDNDFAMMTKVLLRGTISMGELQLNEGRDAAMQEFTGQMTSQKQLYIAALDSFLVAHPPLVNDSRFRDGAETALSEMHNNADMQVINGKIDHDFATILIQLHQGTISISELEIQFGVIDEMKKMAGLIKEKNQEEIIVLEDWLNN